MDVVPFEVAHSNDSLDDDDDDYYFSEKIKCGDFLSFDSPTHLENSEWSDIRLRELRKKYRFSMNEWDPKTAKIILTRFFNFYFTGQTPSNDNLIATVHDCISLAHVKGHQIFHPRSIGDIYYKENASMPTSITSEIRGISKRKPVPAKLSAFHIYIKTAVDKFNTTSTINYFEKQLLGLAGFLALTLCRFATKNIEHVMETFREAQYRKTLESVAGWSGDKPFAFPVKKALNNCAQCLRKTSPKIQALFCLLVDEMVRTYAPDDPKSENQRYLGASVLFHTGYHQIGIIKMLINVCELLETSWQYIRPLLLNEKTHESCELIDNFIKNNLKDGEHGFPWARIIHEHYLHGYSPNDNKELYVIMAAIMQHEKGSTVWEAKWIRGKRSSYRYFKKRGNAIYQIKNIIRRKKSTECRHSLTFCTCRSPPSPHKIKLMQYLIIQIEKDNMSEVKRVLEGLRSLKTSQNQTKS